jgi:hypothetical protein
MPAKNYNLPPLALTAVLLLLFAYVDYETPQLMNKIRFYGVDCLVAASLGICIAQVTLIAAWAVFAPGNIVVRLPWALLLGLMMWYVLTWSEGRACPGSRVDDTINLGISILLGVVVLQLPLWIAKRALRYRMILPGEEPAPHADGRLQFQLKHMLIGTTVFAIALSPLRLILPSGESRGYRPEWEMYVFLAVGICVNLVTTLPCLWGGFVSNAKALALCITWLVYAMLISGFEVVTIAAIVRGPRDDFWLYYLVNFSQGAVVFGVMRAYRALGYRLQRISGGVPVAEGLHEASEAALPQRKTDSSIEEDHNVE